MLLSLFQFLPFASLGLRVDLRTTPCFMHVGEERKNGIGRLDLLGIPELLLGLIPFLSLEKLPAGTQMLRVRRTLFCDFGSRGQLRTAFIGQLMLEFRHG